MPASLSRFAQPFRSRLLEWLTLVVGWVQHSWAAERGEFEGQKTVSYDEESSTARIHVYFRQGAIEQVAYRETFTLASGMVTARLTEHMATVRTTRPPLPSARPF